MQRIFGHCITNTLTEYFLRNANCRTQRNFSVRFQHTSLQPSEVISLLIAKLLFVFRCNLRSLQALKSVKKMHRQLFRNILFSIYPVSVDSQHALFKRVPWRSRVVQSGLSAAGRAAPSIELTRASRFRRRARPPRSHTARQCGLRPGPRAGPPPGQPGLLGLPSCLRWAGRRAFTPSAARGMRRYHELRCKTPVGSRVSPERRDVVMPRAHELPGRARPVAVVPMPSSIPYGTVPNDVYVDLRGLSRWESLPKRACFCWLDYPAIQWLPHRRVLLPPGWKLVKLSLRSTEPNLDIEGQIRLSSGWLAAREAHRPAGPGALPSARCDRKLFPPGNREINPASGRAVTSSGILDRAGLGGAVPHGSTWERVQGPRTPAGLQYTSCNGPGMGPKSRPTTSARQRGAQREGQGTVR